MPICLSARSLGVEGDLYIPAYFITLKGPWR
jgi:hypothetical protein